MTVGRHARGLGVVALVALIAGGCGGNGENKVSAGELKSRLLPPSQVSGFTLYRPFEWDNSIDLVVQGIPMSEATPPSNGVDAADDAGFEAGAAEELRTLKQPPGITIEALKLKSHDGAERLLDFVHKEGLKLPCYASCGELPSDMPVPDIPGAQGIQQVPQPNTPPDTSPFVAYGVGFSIGNYLYLVGGAGAPGSLEKSFILDVAKKEYERVKGS